MDRVPNNGSHPPTPTVRCLSDRIDEGGTPPTEQTSSSFAGFLLIDNSFGNKKQL